jgi:dihydrofolate reductase
MTSADAAPARKIVANYFISLDGVVESPADWHFPYFNDEMGEVVGAAFEASDTLLMGANLYREWSAYWPTSEDQPIADVINSTPKYVVSDSIDKAEWSNSHLIRGDEAADRLRELKAQPGRNVSISGSAILVRWLLREGLLDELSLLVHPIVIGRGQRLFDDSFDKQPLELASSKTLSTGVLHLVYRPAAA